MTEREQQIEDEMNRQASETCRRGILDKRKQQIEAIYKAYPKKIAPEKAKRVIANALDRASYETLLNAAERLSSMVEPYKKKPDYCFCPHPATFFRNDRWEGPSMDELSMKFPPPTRTDAGARFRTTTKYGDTDD